MSLKQNNNDHSVNYNILKYIQGYLFINLVYTKTNN